MSVPRLAWLVLSALVFVAGAVCMLIGAVRNYRAYGTNVSTLRRPGGVWWAAGIASCALSALSLIGWIVAPD